MQLPEGLWVNEQTLSAFKICMATVLYHKDYLDQNLHHQKTHSGYGQPSFCIQFCLLFVDKTGWFVLRLIN